MQGGGGVSCYQNRPKDRDVEETEEGHPESRYDSLHTHTTTHTHVHHTHTYVRTHIDVHLVSVSIPYMKITHSIYR